MLVTEVIGNLGQDAEIRDFGGKQYVSFSIAHSYFSKDQSGTKVENTTWISVLWYGNGGNLFQYLKKGVKLFVRGRQRTKIYTTNTGESRISISINANEVQVCNLGNEKKEVKPKPLEHIQESDLPF